MGGRRIGDNEWGVISAFYRDGSWYGRGSFRHENGELINHVLAGKTERAAKMGLKRQFQRWADGEERPLTSTSKMPDAVARYFDYIREEIDAGNRSPGTIRTYESVWRNHIESNVSGWRLGDVHVDRIDKLLKRISTTAGQQTAKTSRVILGAALREAVRVKAIPHNPMHDARPTPVPRRGDPKALSREEVAHLLERLAADPRAHAEDVPDLVLWMLCTSERIGNALAAAWPRIDLRSAEAQLGPNIVRVSGVGLVERAADVSSKTRSRTIALPKVAVDMLRARQLDQPIGVRWVFPPSDRGALEHRDSPRDPSNTSRCIRQALERAGFKGVTSHVFRKTVATALDDAGVQTRIVSDYLGHSKEHQTRSDYFRRRADAPQLRSALDSFLAPSDEEAAVVDLSQRRGEGS